VQALPPQAKLYRSTRVWAMYVDLVEALGTFEEAGAVYDEMLSLRVATPQAVLNYADFLQQRKFWEDSFKVRTLLSVVLCWDVHARRNAQARKKIKAHHKTCSGSCCGGLQLTVRMHRACRCGLQGQRAFEHAYAWSRWGFSVLSLLAVGLCPVQKKELSYIGRQHHLTRGSGCRFTRRASRCSITRTSSPSGRRTSPRLSTATRATRWSARVTSSRRRAFANCRHWLFDDAVPAAARQLLCCFMDFALTEPPRHVIAVAADSTVLAC
jgi:hypothetical protein